MSRDAIKLNIEMKSSIRKKDKEKQLEILNNYSNKKTFIDEITIYLKESVDNFFNLNCE